MFFVLIFLLLRLLLLNVWIRKQCTYLYGASAALLVRQPRGKLMQISSEKKQAADLRNAAAAAFQEVTQSLWESKKAAAEAAWKW